MLRQASLEKNTSVYIQVFQGEFVSMLVYAWDSFTSSHQWKFS